MIKIDRVLFAAMRAICITCLLLLFLIITASVVNRFANFMSMGWADEIIELLFAWLIFLGAACLWRDHSHFSVDILPRRLRGSRWGVLLEWVVSGLGALFLGMLIYYSLELVLTASDDSPVFSISKRYWYGVMPVAGSIMLAYTLRDLWALASGRGQRQSTPHA